MKIDNNALNLNPQLQGAQAAQANPAADQSRLSHHRFVGKGHDQVQLSGVAANLDNSSRVAQLKASYDAGTYSIAPHQIAASMINYITA